MIRNNLCVFFNLKDRDLLRANIIRKDEETSIPIMTHVKRIQTALYIEVDNLSIKIMHIYVCGSWTWRMIYVDWSTTKR